MTIQIKGGGGAATTPGGSDTQVQFNDGGAFGGDAGLTYNKTTNVLTSTSGEITAPGTGTGSEKLGAGALSAGNTSVAIGNGASAGSQHSIAIGNLAATTGFVAFTGGDIAIGKSASATGSDAIAIGQNAIANQVGSVAIGKSASAQDPSSNQSFAFGSDTISNFSYGVAIGNQARTTAASQFVSGNINGPITNVFFGEGVTSTTNSSVAFAINGTGGAGSNRVGGTIKLAGGKGTGNGTPGPVVFETSTAGASGSGAQSLAERARIDGTGEFNQTAQAAPGTPAEGDMWNDSTQKTHHLFQSGIKQAMIGCIFTQTADKTITNTTTETSAIGTGVGTMTLPANFFVAGKSVRLRGYGVYSTDALGASATVRVKLGSTTIASVTTSALLGGATSDAFAFDVTLTCRTTGATGTVMIGGNINYAAAARVFDDLDNGGATTTVDTTASKLLDVTVEWGAADTDNVVKTTIATAEVLN